MSLRNVLLQSCRTLLSADSIGINKLLTQQIRPITSRKPYVRPPRIKYPRWFLQRERAKYDEKLSKENTEFISEVVHDTFGPPVVKHGLSTYDVRSPLKQEPVVRGEWTVKSVRTGVIARKIGVCPLWTTTGKSILCTMYQVVDNHVIKYIPPEDFSPPRIPYKCPNHKRRLGCLLVGSESADPQLFTKEYCGLFLKQGMMPKKYLGRFLISPESAIQPGTSLSACHFKPGAFVDIRAKTKDRGFQGVMKRWGFHGMPATHGQTKTHRRPGCIGGPKARVWPGKKMPGHVGNRMRNTKGLQVVRINTKYNVLWVSGTGCPGETGTISYIFDTSIYPKRNNHHKRPYFPTFYPEDVKEPLPENLYAEGIFDFVNPTITFEPEETDKKKKK